MKPINSQMLAADLKRGRERTGLSKTYVAAYLEAELAAPFSAAYISAVEAGVIVPTAKIIDLLIGYYDGVKAIVDQAFGLAGD